MKKTILIIAFLLLVLMMFAPVCATELSDAVNRGTIYRNQTIPVTGDICSLMGKTPLAPYYWKYCNDHYPGYPNAVCSPPGAQYGDGFPPTTREAPPGLPNLSKIFLTEMCTDTWWVYEYWEYNATEYIPPAPVADFSCIPTFANLTDDVICTDTSSNTPTSWSWNFDRPDLTNSGEASIYNTLGFEVTQIGHYVVEMTATNAAGSDTISYIIHGIFTGNQTVLNVTPVVTLAPFPTGISNPINVTNLRNSLLDNVAYGNLTQPYIDVVDLFVDYIFNAGSEIMAIFTAPFDWFSGTLASQTEDFETMIGPLISASSIFLQLIARALVSLPAAIINIVTLGLILDVFKIVLKGKGES
jgi:hypothetical protein